MADLSGFDATQVAPTQEFEVLPKGEYVAMMTDSEMKPTRAGDGEYLQCAWEVVDGEHKGRILWDRLNLSNKNETAVKIARATLSAICHAVGVLQPKDSAQLHGKPVIIRVDVSERNDKPGAFRNEIKGYAPKTGATTVAPTVGAKPPWKRSA